MCEIGPKTHRARDILLWFLALVPLFAWSAGALELSQEEVLPGWPAMPEALWYRPYWPDAMFIAADRLLTDEWRVDRSLLRESHAETIERWLGQAEEEDCFSLDTFDDHYDQPPHDRVDFSAAITRSENVFLATVTGLQPGFSFDRPGTLVRVRIDERLKGESEEDKFIFFPIGEFLAGRTRFCVSNRSWPDLPDLGDRLLLLISASSWPSDMPAFPLDPSSIITFHEHRTGHLGSHYRRTDKSLAGADIQSLLSIVRDRLGRALR